MNTDKEMYKKYADARAPKSHTLKNCAAAFLVGGIICTLGQCFRTVYEDICGMNTEDAGTLASVSLILLAVILTGFGVFDKIAGFAGAGTLVPITGFANAVVSPAIDAKSEGYVLGVGAKIFTVAGPVLLYGILSGAVFGLIYFIIGLF